MCGLGALVASSGTAIGSSEFAERLGGGVEISRQGETGKVGFIGTAPGRSLSSGLPSSAPPRAVAKAFIARYPKQFGIAGDDDGVRVTDVHSTLGDGKSIRLQQVHRGVPVLGGELTVSLDSDDRVRSVLGETSPAPDLSVDPVVSGDDAASAASAAVAKAHGVFPAELARSEPKLQVYDPRLLGAPNPLQVARLAWVLEVTGLGSEPIRELVVVDAETGTVALHFNQIAEALNRSVCNANNATAQVPCVSPVRTEGGPPVANDNDDVNLAYDFAGDTYGFFATFGRDSLDDAGMPLISTVDYCEPGTCPNYANAFWNGEQMVYGEGFAAADDVVGHELAHGVTEFSSHLFYYYQSGAINESMSDVFGEFVDLDNGAGTDTAGVRWLLGEDIPGIGAIRDMQNPPAFGHPDRMTSPNYVADIDNDLNGNGDSGGVHSNSGVNNKAAYLITDGDTFNGHTVAGIGIPKASRIYYEVNNSMLGSASDYADLANALPQACTNLIGTAGITAANCDQVEEAVAATEMATDPPAAPTANAPTCTSGTPSFVFNDNLENPGSGNWASSATTGSNSWFYPQTPNPFGFDATYATSGETNFWGFNRDTTSDSSIAMTSSEAIPANAFMRFDHAFGFEDSAGNGTRWDGGVVEYSTNNGTSWNDAGPLIDAGQDYNGTITTGNPLAGRQAFTSESNGYGSTRLNLSSLAGDNVRFRFRLGTDSSVFDYGWFIDDVRIYTCSASDTTPPDTTITSGPAAGSTTNDNTPTFGFSSTEAGSTFECAVDAGAFAACTSPRTIGPLADGAHTFRARATDPAANTDPSPASRTFTVDTTPPDTTPPDTTITSGPAAGSTTNDNTPTFGFSSTEAGSTFECSVDGGAFVSCSSPNTIGPLADGAHTFRARATDPAANTDPSPASRTFTVDTTPPDGGGTPPPDGAGTPPPDGPGPPDNQFTLGKLNGKTLSITVPGPGEVEVRDAADRGAGDARATTSKKKRLLKPSSATAATAGPVTVKLKLTRTAKKVLKKKGKVKVRAAITFTPTGGTARTEIEKLKIKKKRRD